MCVTMGCLLRYASVQAMPTEEIDDCLRALTGEPLNEDKLCGHEFVGAQEVAQELLGFEDY